MFVLSETLPLPLARRVPVRSEHMVMDQLDQMSFPGAGHCILHAPSRRASSPTTDGPRSLGRQYLNTVLIMSPGGTYENRTFHLRHEVGRKISGCFRHCVEIPTLYHGPTPQLPTQRLFRGSWQTSPSRCSYHASSPLSPSLRRPCQQDAVSATLAPSARDSGLGRPP